MQADLERLAVIWQHFDKIDKPAGDFLCGDFSIVDAMFAPVAWRTKGYQLSVSGLFSTWSRSVMQLPAMDQWVEEGALETWRVEETENVGR